MCTQVRSKFPPQTRASSATFASLSNLKLFVKPPLFNTSRPLPLPPLSSFPRLPSESPWLPPSGLGTTRPSSRRCRSRCGHCNRKLWRRPRPYLDRRSEHVAGHSLRRTSWRWSQAHRTGRQACSDLRGGSRTTNQYHSSEYVCANVFTKERHRDEGEVGSLPRGTETDRS